nr:transglutaminase domain-containing protein [Candidatus Sigynarchaeum springense]
MNRTNRIAFTLVTLALVGMQLAVLPAMPASAISPTAYYGPPPAGTFTYNRNTTYFYNYTYTISKSGFGPFLTERWIPMITNRTILSGSGVRQQEFVMKSMTYGSSLSHVFDTDDFGNEFHYFDLSVASGTTWTMNVQGNLTLRDVTWSSQSGVTMADYNKTDGLYALYTKEELYINKSFDPIVTAASSLNASNPWTTVANVYNHVKNLLTYSAQSEEHGAEWAITYHTGDCTEYSYLMVALLRSCGIPARVLRGLVIADSAGSAVNPNYGAAVGTKWRFVFETSDYDTTNANLTGHAWAEYFIPGAGWVLSDPTWGDGGGTDFTSRVDNVHVPYTVGVWIGQGLNPPLSPTPSENVSTIPYPFWLGANVDQAVHYDFMVLSQQAPPSIWDQILDFFVKNPWVLYCLVGLIAIVIVIYAIRKRRKNSGYSDSGSYRERVTFSS